MGEDSNQHHEEGETKMKTSCWLRVTERGSVNATKMKPNRIGVDEIALRLELDLPGALFTKPRLVATMRVPEKAVSQAEITTSVTDNLEEAIKTATGLDMVVRIKEEEDDESN